MTKKNLDSSTVISSTNNVKYHDILINYSNKLKVNSNGCWEWQLSLRRGYGQIKINNENLAAHRFFYEKIRGKIPNGLVLDHLCRNKKCCNPEHLEPVTHIININRGISATKTHCKHGHPLFGVNLRESKRGRECRICYDLREKYYKYRDSKSKLLHQRKRSEASLSDEYETPLELFKQLNYDYELNCELDVCCDDKNIKGIYRLPNGNALDYEWKNTLKSDVWCNPPHSQNEKFVRKAHEQWKNHNINIMMILPCNTQSSKYWHECIENQAEYHPIKGRIRFLVDGKPSKHPSRNAYCVVIWRKK